MELYILRYFFSAGSGVCLWSANESAREKYGYPIDMGTLTLPPLVAWRAAELIERFDTSMDWDYPSRPSPWSKAEYDEFQMASAELLQALRDCLGKTVEIRDESS